MCYTEAVDLGSFYDGSTSSSSVLVQFSELKISAIQVVSNAAL